MKAFAFALLAAIAMLQSAAATPLTLSYSVYGQGTYRYNFALTLDNHDGSWDPGDSMNWVIFGDKPGPDTSQPYGAFITGFVFDQPTLRTGPLTTSTSCCGHNGPTLMDFFNIYVGWKPTAIGDALTWSGTSATYLGAGQLLWSNLIGNGVNLADYEVAQYRDTPAPEPASIALFAIGLLGAGFAARRKRANPICQS